MLGGWRAGSPRWPTMSKSRSARKRAINTTSRPATMPGRLDKLSETALLSLDSGRWDINTGSEKLRPEDLLFRERPSTPQDAFMRARSWAKENWFVRMILNGQVTFFNYGLEILPEDNTPKARKELKDFFKKNRKTHINVHRYINEVFKEYILNQNVVSFWREKKKDCPFLLLGEQCEYVDVFGIPRLWWNPNMRPKIMPDSDDIFEFSGMSTTDVKNRYFSGKKIELDEDWDEYFEVLTTNYRGLGFSVPDMYSVFRTLSQTESMEVGDNMLGLLSRRVTLDHKIGFQLQGQGAGPNAAFQKDLSIWTKKRADAIIAFYNGRFGFMENVTNFDYTQKIYTVDPKLFEGKKWDTVINRLMWWSGPLGFMMICKQPNPFLLGIFKTMADNVRGEVKRHLEYTLNVGVKKMPAVQLKWSDRCFLDMRLAWDMVSGLMKQGPLSLTTSLEEGGFEPDKELERKKAEKGQSSLYVPLLTAQGPGSGGGGRPAQKSAGAVKTTGSKQKNGR